MKVYIIGKVTGLLYDEVCTAFNERQLQLEERGHEVVNPVKIVPEECGWEEAMRICIAQLVTCDAVSLLDNAVFSRGGTLEMLIAGELRLQRLQ